MFNTTDAATPQPTGQPVTIEQLFNKEIAQARTTLEKLCIAKAKAETLGMLQYPAQGLREVFGWIV